MKNSLNSRIFAAMFAAYVGAIAFPGPAQAEIADLSNVPLANSPSDAVLPNLMYILDDSGSMRWDYMPDNVHYLTSGTTLKNCKDTSGTVANATCSDNPGPTNPWVSSYGEPPYYSSNFNQIFYNPDVFYAAAVDDQGTTKGDSVYTAAPKDGYNDATTLDLSTKFPDIYYCADKSARFSGRISNSTGLLAGTILTVTAVAAGQLKVGDVIESPATTNTKIASFGTGTGGAGTYNVDISQQRGTIATPVAMTVAMPATPVAATLADNTVCRRNGIDNKTATFGYFLYWSTSTTNGGLPYAGFTNRKIMTGSGYYFTITAHEYCKDDNLWDCALANADGTAPNNFTNPAPIRYCNSTTNAGSGSAVADAAGSATHKCQANFDPSNYQYPRYGRFKRVNLDQPTYTKSVSAVRPDCASATVCTLAEEQKNFANWFTWYRTRLTMMKTATGRAFVDINDRYRVGFITINPGSPVSKGTTYLPIAKFDATQKKDFYTILYSQTNHGSTPLREALARVGRHYAGIKTGINSGMTEDPVTHSCQQNFSLLTSDGYWNDSDTDAQNMAGNPVGNQDNVPSTTTPIYVSRATVTIDGQGTTEKVDAPFLVTEQAKCSGSSSIDFGDSGTAATRACGCTGNQTAIWQRTRVENHTETFDSGKSTGTSINKVSGSETFTLITGCTTPLIVTQVTPKIETERMVCQYQNNTTFGGNTGTQQSCGCAATNGSNKYRLKERKRTYNQTVVTTDGVAAAPTNGTSTYTFTNINPTPSNTCLNSSPSGAFTASTANGTPIPAPTDNAASGGVNLAVTFTATSVANGSPTTTTVTAAGYSNKLADVAMYYYKTDLRASMTDNVPTNDKDVAPHQHMTTFTLGLGLKGQVEYVSNYETATTGDFANIRAATIDACTWIPAGKRCDWPNPVSGSMTTLDDLWHAAVNGRGTYYSASDPNSLADSLTSALSALKVQTAAASASATSSPNITETENFIYSSTFRTVLWDGEVSAQRIDPTTGAVIPTIEWSAQQKLDLRIKTVVNPGDSDDRLIYTFESGNANGRKEFFFDQLTGTVGGVAEQKWFDSKCTAFSQCSGLSTAQKDIANDGKNLVNYLRGRGEFAIAPGNVFRTREHVLGDPINATPAFISKPHFGFVDDGYADFKTAQNARQGVLYIAANDGMLHALNGDTGAELWSYVPRIVFPRLHKLASEQWTVNHEYSVDGSPQIMDIFDDGLKAWRTILVAGLNKGGRGYYALDITNPTSAGPLGMWEICADTTVCEITDDDMGYTYGNPVITKRASDGKWVVIVTSGMNNVSPGSGRGFLYVLDALTGKILDKVEAIDGATTWGDAATPSGLSKISAFANSFNTDNTATFVYGGDLYGNVWRFDMSASPPKVLKLGELKDAGGKPQSVTSRPELGIISGNRVIFIGTGRYLGQSDLSDPATLSLPWAYQQSFYAFKDKDAGYGGDIRRSTPGLVQQTISETAGVRTTSTNPVKWDSTNDGWFVDFNPGTAPGLSPGERVNLDPQLILGTLVVVTNVPNKDACSTGGDSFLYQFDYRSGSYIATSANNAVAQKFTGKITVGVVIVRLPKGIFKGIVTGASGQKTSTGVNLGSGGGTGRRVSWRELIP